LAIGCPIPIPTPLSDIAGHISFLLCPHVLKSKSVRARSLEIYVLERLLEELK
jgi:hypothetical protein